MPADERHNLSVRGLFYGIGHQPNSGIYGGQLELDEAGYVQVGITDQIRPDQWPT